MNTQGVSQNMDVQNTQLEKLFFGEPENKSQAIELEKLFKVLQRYKFLLVLFLVAGGVLGYLGAKNKTPLYTTSASIIVEPESSNRAEFLNNRLRYYVPSSFYETQMVVLKSKVVLERAARSLSPVIVQKLFRKPDQKWFSNYMQDLLNRLKSWLSLIGMGDVFISSGSNETNSSTYSISSVTNV